ncbi:MAG: GNAT family N-acetyltransferase [Pseudomonadota bacterium]
MLDVPRIETERLILRGLENRDTDAFCEMMANDEVARFITPQGKGIGRGDAWRSMATVVGHWALRGYGFFAVEEKATGQFVGRVGPWQPEGWPALECGWTIARPYWGKGYASEAAIAGVRWIFAQQPELTRIISVIDPGNEASKAVARKIGERDSAERWEFWGATLEIWECPREQWLARFGGVGS